MKKLTKLLMLPLLIGVGVSSLTSCGAFFGDEFMITRYEVSIDGESDSQIVTFYFSDENQSPLTLKIPKGDDGVGIKDIKTDIVKDVVNITIYFTDDSTPKTFEIPIVNGKDGRGIMECVVEVDKKTGDTIITFYYTDESEPTKIVIPQGQEGVGIEGITSEIKKDSVLITITLTNGTTFDFPVPNAVGVNEVIYDEESSTEDSYAFRFVFNDGTSNIVLVPRPKEGKDGSLWFTDNGSPLQTLGKEGDFYLDKNSGKVYQKINDTWTFILKLSVDEMFDITFDPNGGYWSTLNKEDNSLKTYRVMEGKYLSSIPTPIKDNSTFLGWFTSSDNLDINQGQFTTLTPVFDDLILYARWK